MQVMSTAADTAPNVACDEHLTQQLTDRNSQCMKCSDLVSQT